MKKRISVTIASILAMLLLITGTLVGFSLAASADEDPTSGDNYAGTLTCTPSEDGTTMTISYMVNGETVSYTVPNNYNYTTGAFAGVDDVDRSLYDSNEVGAYGSKSERYIGLFYFLWQGEHGDSGIFDLQKIIDTVGVEAAGSTNCGMYGPVGAMHWFAEPLYGYYYANDAWVQRKHVELLTNANIDFLYFDITNGYPYLHNAIQLMSILHEFNEAGYDAPQVVFYTNSNAHGMVQQVYNEIYSKNLFADTWFCWEGKPIIVAPADANINDFFHIKQNQWPTEGSKRNGWPWMDFQWPSRVFRTGNDFTDGGAISVSVAQHSGTVAFSDSSLYGNVTNRGRSFNAQRDNGKFQKECYDAWLADPSLTNYGLNFQAQFDRAIEQADEGKVMYILVTGWNEWVAQRQNTNSDRIWFVDTSSMEFSRDTEMMRGGYFDNYYMQLIYNVQKAKGAAPIVVQDARKAIDINGSFDQWDSIGFTYHDPSGDTVDRNATGFGHTNYTNDTGNNDIVAAKVISDTKNVYFYVETAADITPYVENTSWMQLYLNADGDAATGWYGYDYILNHAPKSDTVTTIAKQSAADNAFYFEEVGEISYRMEGNKLMLAVPQELIGAKGYLELAMEFKWADSDTLYDEMEDFYCDGDAAPLGRLNYVYQNYIPEVSQITYPWETTVATEAPTEPETEPATETPTEAPTVAETEAETEVVTEPAKSGCGAALATALLPLIMLCGAAVVYKKRK